VGRQAEELIELLGLEAFRDKFVGQLSTGSRRIVELACVLAHRPNVLLLDEPSSGIAQRETEALGPLLRRIQTETGAAIVIIEHDMPLITDVADELLALDLGKVVVRDKAAAVLAHPHVVSSYLGSSAEIVARSGDVEERRPPKRRRGASSSPPGGPHEAHRPARARERRARPPPGRMARRRPGAARGLRTAQRVAGGVCRAQHDDDHDGPSGHHRPGRCT
jgi:ABC-type glutathione transport system ATPase component